MGADPKKLIDVYVYRKEEEGTSFLLLKRSKKKIYGNQWRMIGGKVKKNESHWQAALRELDEETGLKPVLFWSVPTLNHFYEHRTDQVHLIPAFAAEIQHDSKITLDNEHSGFEWVGAKDTSRYIYWPEQKRIMNCIHEIVTKDQILPDWIIDYNHI